MKFNRKTEIVFFFLLFLLNKNIIGNRGTIEEIYKSPRLSYLEKYDSITASYFNEATPLERLSSSNKLIELALSDNDNKWLFHGYYQKANAYYYIAESEKACRYYFKCLDIFPTTDLEGKPYSVFIGLGNAYSMSGDNEKSIFYYQKALESIPDSNLKYYGYTLLNIVDGLQRMNLIDSSGYFLQKADSLFAVFNDNIGTAYVLGHKAILYAKDINWNLAEYNFYLADSILQKEGDSYSVLGFQAELAKVYLKKGENKLALVKLDEGYNNSQELGYRELKREFSKLLSEAYSNLGEYEKAFRFQKEYIALNDSICSENSIRKIADIRTEYEVSQKQLKIDLLENKRQLNRIVIMATIVILLVVSFLTALINKNLKIVKKQRKKLIAQKQKLEDLILTKDKMFSIISHDLRGPLHSLSGVSGLIRELIKNDNKDILIDVGDSLGKSLNSITLLLDNLLEWSLNEQGKIPFNPEKIDAYNLFVELYEIFYGPAEAKGIELILTVKEGNFLKADHNTLSTIFRNLISNAVKFSNSGDKIILGAETIANKIRFSIADTGVGMEKEKQESLFQFTGTKSTYGTGQERGIGLGLRLAYEFTKLNKGEIYVESELNKGTTFFVELPV